MAVVAIMENGGLGIKGTFFALLAALVLNACVTGIGSGSGVEVSGVADTSKEVGALAQARWDSLLHGDVTAAYGYLSPAYRAMLPLVKYQQRVRAGFWKGAVVDTVSCEPEVCNVKVVVTYDYREVKGVASTLNESWVRVDGKWWYAPKK